MKGLLNSYELSDDAIDIYILCLGKVKVTFNEIHSMKPDLEINEVDGIIKDFINKKLMLDLIKMSPGLIQVKISEKLGIKQQNCSYNLRELITKDLIQELKIGKRKYYYPVIKNNSNQKL